MTPCQVCGELTETVLHYGRLRPMRINDVHMMASALCEDCYEDKPKRRQSAEDRLRKIWEAE